MYSIAVNNENGIMHAVYPEAFPVDQMFPKMQR